MAVHTITSGNSRTEPSDSSPTYGTQPGDDTAGADTLIVQQGAFLIQSGGGDAVFLAATGIWTVSMNGSLSGNAGLRLAAGIPGVSKISIGADGSVSGANGGIVAGSTVTLKNLGVISGGSGDAILLGAGNDSVTNSGDIIGDITLGEGHNSFNNSGSVSRDVMGGGTGGSDTVTNSGVIRFLLLGDGKNIFTNSGTIGRDYSGGSGADTVTNAGYLGEDVRLGDGTNKLINKKTVVRDVLGGTGSDTLINSGEIGFPGDPSSIEFGNGSNRLANSGTLLANYTGGDDDDTITNSQKVGKKIVKGSIIGDMVLGGGSNTVINPGKIEGEIQSLGASTITNSGTLTGHLLLGFGNDVVTNTGRITGVVDLFLGSDRLTNKGTINGFVSVYGGVAGDSGEDIVINSGRIGSYVFLGQGSNRLINSGTIGEIYTGGEDVDRVTNFQKINGKIVDGKILGVIDLAGGADIFKGGKYAEMVVGGDGNDVITLGGGADIYLASGSNGADGNDSVDGGTGVDTYDASASNHSLLINLDTKQHEAPGAGLAAANTAADYLAETFSDHITNFENAIGGQLGDSIYGTAAANRLEGRGGIDAVVGLGGNDTLIGGDDADALIGGAGKDTLWGDDEFGGGTPGGDVFMFLAIGDSGVGKAKRDVIMDFNSGDGDHIDLEKIDADTTNGSGDDDFDFIGTNVMFHQTAGELRIISIANGLVVEGDVDGDGKADFQIEVRNPVGALVFDL